MAVERLRVKIGGMSCSFCSEMIRKAYSRMEAVLLNSFASRLSDGNGQLEFPLP